MARRAGTVRDTGIIVLGHGSKVKKANNAIPGFIGPVKKALGLRSIVPAYLQLARPSLSESIRGLVNKGCRKVIIVPFFLLSGNHVSRDIPGAIKKERLRCPQVSFTITRNLGDDVRIAEIIKDRIEEALEGGCA